MTSSKTLSKFLKKIRMLISRWIFNKTIVRVHPSFNYAAPAAFNARDAAY